MNKIVHCSNLKEMHGYKQGCLPDYDKKSQDGGHDNVTDNVNY